MMREQLDWNLRDAFPKEPQACHDALMQAAYSVREEKKARRMTWRTVLLTVLVLLATISVATAVGRWLGWTNFLEEDYGIHVTDRMQGRMDATEQRSFQVGPLTLTLHECLADGRIAISNFVASTTDGTAALYVGDVAAFDPIGVMGETEAKRLGVDESLSWQEVAQKLDLPLYNVRALMEITSSAYTGTSMEDMIWDNEGRLNYLNLSYLEPMQVKDTLPVRFYLAVSGYDPATGEETGHWVVEEESEIPVLEKLDEKYYTLPETSSINGFQVEEVRAELYDTGVYLLATLSAPEGMKVTDEAMDQLYQLFIKDENGEDFPGGILYNNLNIQQWPLIRLGQMASLEEIPQRIILDGMILE